MRKGIGILVDIAIGTVFICCAIPLLILAPLFEKKPPKDYDEYMQDIRGP